MLKLQPQCSLTRTILSIANIDKRTHRGTVLFIVIGSLTVTRGIMKQKLLAFYFLTVYNMYFILITPTSRARRNLIALLHVCKLRRKDYDSYITILYFVGG